MKRIAYISVPAQAQIIREYKQKNPDGSYTWLLKDIAERHGISLSSVNNLAKAAHCQCRPRGGRTRMVPDARIMKILRDASEPFITMEEVGRRNPRTVIMGNGRSKSIPLSKQRVSQIVARWSEKLDAQSIHTKGFRPGDKIEWADQKYIVMRYDNSHRGAVIDLNDLEEIDPFCWVFKGSRSKLVEATDEELTPKDVERRYVKKRAERAKELAEQSDGDADSKQNNGTTAQR